MTADSIVIPAQVDNAILKVDGRDVRLTNLRKPFWPELGITKGALIQYYADVALVLLPHIRDRAMVMRRYPNGAAGASFFMKEAPFAVLHGSASARSITATAKSNFPVIDDRPSLLWLINLGCIDLNQ